MAPFGHGPLDSVGVAMWALVALIGYVYLGYPLLLAALSSLVRPFSRSRPDGYPLVSMIIPAYNEERAITLKIDNTLALDYPHEELEIIVASDGSTDRTNAIALGYQAKGVQLVALPTNQGKSAAENAALAFAQGEIIVFSDATGMYSPNALKELIGPFADNTIGCVAGLVKYENIAASASSNGEGIYWRYEVFLRLLESKVGNLAMASGSILACRRSVAERLDAAVGEDFVIPMRAAMRGLRTVYVPAAVSRESIVETDRGLMRTKIRIIVKDLRGLVLCRPILNPFRHPLYAWGLLSHKLLRWLVPYFLVLLLICNILLANYPLYFTTLLLQVLIYFSASVGYVWQKKGKPPVLLNVPFSFCLVNLAALVGVARFLAGKKAGRWEPAR